MLMSSRSRRMFVVWALPLAVWAAVPPVRWCPLGWQQACATALLRCSAAASPIACESAAGRCPLADAQRAPVSHGACAAGAGCLLAPPTPTAAHESTHSGRTYCAGDPNGGAGVLAQSPHVHPASSLPAIVPAPDLALQLVAVATLGPERASRPPPRPWSRRPPARARAGRGERRHVFGSREVHRHRLVPAHGDGHHDVERGDHRSSDDEPGGLSVLGPVQVPGGPPAQRRGRDRRERQALSR